MVNYEWCVEHWDVDPDKFPDEAEIVDLNFSDKLFDLYPCDPINERIVLVRTTDGDRQWAYIDPKSVMLPAYFSTPQADGKYYETATKVPQQFHREIARVACGGR